MLKYNNGLKTNLHQDQSNLRPYFTLIYSGFGNNFLTTCKDKTPSLIWLLSVIPASLWPNNMSFSQVSYLLCCQPEMRRNLDEISCIKYLLVISSLENFLFLDNKLVDFAFIVYFFRFLGFLYDTTSPNMLIYKIQYLIISYSKN